jgi:hypothetical protein
MTKLCECGCGQPTPISKRTYGQVGWVKGQPKRFISGHAVRGNKSALKHGMSRTPEWDAFIHAKDRCTNPKNTRWEDYGGRGIRFRFASFEDFFAEVGPRPSPKHSLDRKENDGHYAPGNLRRATPSEQQRNKRIKRIPDVETMALPQRLTA